jgi:hypothetical protein
MAMERTPHWGNDYYDALVKSGMQLDPQNMEDQVTWAELYAFTCKLKGIQVTPSGIVTPVPPTPVIQTNSIFETKSNKGIIYEFKNKSNIKSTYGTDPNNESVRFIKIHPDNFAIWEAESANNPENILHKKAFNIEQVNGYGMNAIFFGTGSAIINGKKTTIWAHDGIFGVENKVLCDHACHAKPWNDPKTWYPQSCIIYYKDGTFGIEVVKNIKEITKPYFWVLSGIGLTNWNPAREGFIGAMTGPLRFTDHTSIGITEDNYIILARSYQCNRIDTIQHMKKLGCKMAVGLDGGGSTQYRVPGAQRPSSSSSMRLVPSMVFARDLMI